MALHINCQGKCQLCSHGALFENSSVYCVNYGAGKWNSSSMMWKLVDFTRARVDCCHLVCHSEIVQALGWFCL